VASDGRRCDGDGVNFGGEVYRCVKCMRRWNVQWYKA
jgi:hypothetical protein